MPKCKYSSALIVNEKNAPKTAKKDKEYPAEPAAAGRLAAVTGAERRMAVAVGTEAAEEQSVSACRSQP